MRRVSGLDVNGWRDIAARDWDIEEPDVQLEAARIVDGGLGSVAVKQNSGDWIGGPQALLAPHGRGQGWGEIGSPERRLSLAPMLDDLRPDTASTINEIYGATVNALARGTDEVILSVPDVPNFDEAAQFRTLSIFHRDRRQFRLLWRPVAAFLHALDCHAIPPNADGALFCFLIHSGTGIEVQTLRLRRDSEHCDHVAPERDGYGSRILRNLGLKQLTDRAHASVVAANPILAEGFCERSTLAPKLICGERRTGDIEILRLNNGNWIEIIAPEIAEGDIFSNTDFTRDLDFATSETITATFLLTPLAAPFASVLSRRLQAFFPNVTTLDWDATARGSLRAGRLIEKGLPHYFDRLTPISLAVMKRDEPHFDDLIGSNATLPANREYVSPPYRDLKWIAGKHDIEFYVLKGDDEIRFWNVHLEEAPKTDVGVELRIRQTPGQSWAKLSLTSPEWEPLQRAPIFLDWTTLDPIEASPEEILEKLRTPPPTIPLRIVELPSIEFWTGSDRLKGMNSVLAQMDRAGAYNPAVLAPLLSRTLRDPSTQVLVRPVGTDGVLPNELSEQAQTYLTTALEQCAKQIAASRRPLSDNGPLRCLTWTFTRCPENIQDMIVEALEADLNQREHPLLAPRSARKVLIQGAGRAVTSVPRLRRVLQSLVSRPANADTMNAFAMILARREEAPQALTAALVDKIVDLASNELVYLTERLSFQTRFKNALSAIAGLFRYREVEPFALLAGPDAAAQKLRDNLEKAQAFLERHRNRVPRFEEKLGLITSIRDFLDGSGDPAILVRIEDLADDETNGDDQRSLAILE